MRSYLWLVVFSYMDRASSGGGTYGFEPYLNEPWKQITQAWHVHCHRFADEYSGSSETQISAAKKIIATGNYHEVLGFIEFIARHRSAPREFSEQVNLALKRAHCPYRLIENNMVPVASAAEQEAVILAFENLRGAGASGAQSHLAQAGRFLTAGEWADSIRESILAVESLARFIDPSGKTLGDALKALEKKGHIHSALSGGFLKLYGYTNSEEGIRHSLISEPEAKVGETEALYMFGSCASFSTYLIRKSNNVS